MTYLQQQKAGNTAWVDELDKSKGYLWATPGKYLREGMLIALAKAAGDMFLPQAWEQMIKTTSFNNSEDTPNKSDTVEKEYGRTISAELEMVTNKAWEQNNDSESDTDAESN